MAPTKQPEADRYTKTTSSEDYWMGVDHGCRNANREYSLVSDQIGALISTETPPQRDADKWANSEDYRGGWDDGHHSCWEAKRADQRSSQDLQF